MRRAHVISFIARREAENFALYTKRGRNALLCNFILKYDGAISRFECLMFYISGPKCAEVSQAGRRRIRGSRKVVTRRMAHSSRDTPNENYFSGVINVHRERIAMRGTRTYKCQMPRGGTTLYRVVFVAAMVN